LVDAAAIPFYLKEPHHNPSATTTVTESHKRSLSKSAL
jgi:hypothetical protein